MSLDKFVTRGFTASTGGGLDNWVAKTAPTPGGGSPTPSHSSGTSFVMGSSPGSRSGSSRAGEALGERGSERNVRGSQSHSSSRGSSGGSSDADRRRLSDDVIVWLFPKCDPRLVMAVLAVLAVSAGSYLLIHFGGFGKDSDSGSYGRSVQSEILERRGRLR